ncbi:lysosomal acid lipase/cholesteryl ester hydrolase-like [Phymastichus coffea]|uniref:lysosomal acid lipase/cholesteryl ester hydrolase-like n=1 Tax=Phymastichus coffea TaxID=108790 RepID=UPI00273AE746|nr:lysosomal acid lipase/cholesteryl ester hydrolase-like [Phymastichus coffea]
MVSYVSYISRRLPEKHYLFLSRLVGIMRNKYLKIAAFSLIALAVAFPKEMNIPLVKREIDRISARADFTACSNEPEEEMTTIQMIKRWGYKAEEHFVTTEDGYILALHRIPGAKGSTPVLMHHALLESSSCWVITGKSKALAFILADMGYDVWMANSRGNTYSRNHTTKSPSNQDFWDFSWHEMGIYDLPAEIKYISSINDKSLLYIGHSMGTTMFYVMASERPDEAVNVKAMFGLAPVAFTNNIRGPFYIFGNILHFLQDNANHQGKYEFFNQNQYFKFAAKCICSRPLLRNICDIVIQSVVGFSSKQSDAMLLPLVLTHTPAGTSMKTIMHFAQGIQSKQFRHYDHGIKINNQRYKNPIPPEYDFRKIQVPITLFWGQNDFLAQPKDVKRLYDQLPKKVAIYKINDPEFNHLDFLWGIDAPKLVYSRLIALMDEYRYSNETTST